MKKLDSISLFLLCSSIIVVAQSPACKIQKGITVVLNNEIEDPLDPSVELLNDGRMSAVFEAWAIQKLQSQSQEKEKK